MTFPISTIKEGGRTEDCRIDVETMDIDVHSIGMRTRNVIAVDATDSTEVVFREVGSESIGSYRVVSGHELEVLSWDNEMPKSFFGADTTVAFQGIEASDSHRVMDGATVTTTSTNHGQIGKAIFHV